MRRKAPAAKHLDARAEHEIPYGCLTWATTQPYRHTMPRQPREEDEPAHEEVASGFREEMAAGFRAALTRQWAGKLLSTIAAAISMLILAATGTRLLVQGPDRELAEKIHVSDSVDLRLKRAADVDKLASQIAELRVRIDSLFTLPEGSEMASEVAGIKAAIANLDTRFGALETALGNDTARALSVPLLRKDIENLGLSSHVEIAAAKAEIDRVYDQNKWFLGLVGTMAIGLLGLAISSLLQGRRK